MTEVVLRRFQTSFSIHRGNRQIIDHLAELKSSIFTIILHTKGLFQFNLGCLLNNLNVQFVQTDLQNSAKDYKILLL